MPTLCVAKELKINSQLKQRPSGSGNLVTRESSMVALGRRVGEKLREAGVKAMQNTGPAYNSRSAGHAESGVRIVKEKVRTLLCYAREVHGVTLGRSNVSLPWCVRFAAQKISRSHRGTDGMAGYRRAYGR